MCDTLMNVPIGDLVWSWTAGYRNRKSQNVFCKLVWAAKTHIILMDLLDVARDRAAFALNKRTCFIIACSTARRQNNLMGIFLFSPGLKETAKIFVSGTVEQKLAR